MAIHKSPYTPKLSLNVQHEYITLRMPNGSFTASFSRFKGSGGLDKDSFGRLIKFVEESKSFLAGMEMLLNPEVLTELFPSWDSSQKESPRFKVGDVVTTADDYIIKNFGATSGLVEKVTSKNVIVRFPKGRIKASPSLFSKS